MKMPSIVHQTPRQTFENMKFNHFIILAPPGPPVSIKVPKVGEDFVELDWKAPSRDGGSKVKAYHIYQSTTPGDWQELATVKSFDNHYSVSGLKEGVAYNFAVAAENEAGVGKLCETDKAVKPVKPKGQCVFNMYHSSVVIFPH